MKDVILTTAIDYDYEQIKLFLNSLNSFYTGEVVIFSNYSYNLKYLKFKLRVITVSENLIEETSSLNINSANNFRYPLYYDFLEKNYYDNILLTDARDVILQANPFNKINDDLLYVAAEDNFIGNCTFNSHWIETLYGKSYLEQHATQDIICSGTTLGRYNMIVEYLNYISSEIKLFSKNLDTGNNTFILDQGIHNYYCTKFSDKVKKFTNNDDLFFTLGYTEFLKLNKAGLLVNDNNRAYAIIHQYDRFKWLSKHFEYQLRDTIQKNDSLNLSIKKGLKRNVKEAIRYASLKSN